MKKAGTWGMSSHGYGARQMKSVMFLVALATFLFSSMFSRAQSTTSAVNGTVTDATGAIVVAADVQVTNSATGVVYSATSDNLGAYHVTQLPPGTYTMSITKTGFQTQNIQPFKLVVDQQFSQNIVLAVGQTTESISVSADALLIDTQTSNQGQVIESQQITDMPLNGRDVLQLAQLSAGDAFGRLADGQHN